VIALRERTATLEEWRELVERVRAKRPDLAAVLVAGSSFVANGERVHPPLGYVADDSVRIHKITTTTDAPPNGRV
jgi:hypothetical protein